MARTGSDPGAIRLPQRVFPCEPPDEPRSGSASHILTLHEPKPPVSYRLCSAHFEALLPRNEKSSAPGATGTEHDIRLELTGANDTRTV
jgi:hypothetical protein